MKRKIFYINDELNDEFSGIVRKEITIDENFKYIPKNILWRFLAFIIYYLFVFPFAYLYLKFNFAQKVKGKEKLKEVKSRQYFIYINHTQAPGDGFLPACVLFPHKPYVVVNKDNLATKGTKNIMQMLGAVPIPTTIKAMGNFKNALEELVKNRHPIVIYPEAHIWPFYTDIRSFSQVSFRYPVKMGLPIYTFTNVYTKKRGIKPRMTTYVDGPFSAPENVSEKEQMMYLRNMAYNAMKERAKLATYSVHTYIKNDKSQGNIKKEE